jgi:DUF4097 and DUF4098 domain-containing protein YvlB
LLIFTGLALVVPGAFARGESRIEKTLNLDPKGRFVLDTDQGSVTVTGTSNAGARVVVTSNRDDLESLFEFSFEGSASEARVTARRRHWDGWPRNISMHFEVEVPAETRTEIQTSGGSLKLFGLRGDSQLKTSGGSIEVSGLNGRLEAETSGGGIRLREVAGNARVETSGGGIEVESVDGSVRAHTSGGPIRIDRVTGSLEAKTSGGSVHANFGKGNFHGGDLETSGGSIEVAVDPSANFEIDASTSGGSVSSDLPIRVVGRISSSSLHGTIGSGGELLRLHTSGGSIHIRSL